MRERPCSAGDAAWCDGSERDVEVCNDNPCYDWTVKDRIFFNYFQIYIFKKQNLFKKSEKGWTGWSSWSECSKSCGDGKKERNRFCKDLDNACEGPDYEVENCNEMVCPTNFCAKELRITVPDFLHTKEFFPYEGLYHRIGSFSKF